MVLNLRIGIIGGGFAGLYTVSFLRKFISQGIDITLFDKNNYFLYTPVLHEMATGTVNARHVVIPIRKAEDPREFISLGTGPFLKGMTFLYRPPHRWRSRKESMLLKISCFVPGKKSHHVFGSIIGEIWPLWDLCSGWLKSTDGSSRVSLHGSYGRPLNWECSRA